ncbi:ABC-F family ATP-binding cassette domain-containing protein [Vibrio parahaemolyticus]|uniref:ATP-binding cassette domain-containing protein n=1 Tax=Vibrio parahaemolyticus TaxID=670 RepID=UPI001D16AE0F|nr:ATP-binding cassette domain-containing protein [Vibrio parahaemolyticus]MCC3842711.1 ABC-F family ATP-binding cassette domain-containing protein [Vibrio parahaemolyticus]
MPVLQAFNVSHQFDNGETLFQSISCSMTKRRVGLVGRNGIGKSLLASILAGETQPASGVVTSPSSFMMYRQQPSDLLSGQQSIAQFLGTDSVLHALKQLAAMGLPQDPDFSCARLSGGQLARLQLWQLFENEAELLILDEPSNHLDTEAKQWLIESMTHFGGAILLISHDRELLRAMEEIWELSGLGLQVFGGNYDVYAEQKRTELQAVERQLAQVDKQKKRLAEQAQKNREKADQRAAQGNKLRKDGSQPKILLDGKKDSATASASNRNKNEQLRQVHLQAKERALQSRHEQLKAQKLYLADNPNRSRKVLSIQEGILPFGDSTPITLQIFANDKVHLKGKNGCGKSTLLNTLLGELSLLSGELQVNTPLYYLDQHFGAVNPNLSLLENVMETCQEMTESEARTLLAGIGFRRDAVFRLGCVLSGGEKMKLAMLIVSHQHSQPLLLLDEPDNHLDLESKIMLSQALNVYKGGFVLISHDQDFASESGVLRQIELT